MKSSTTFIFTKKTSRNETLFTLLKGLSCSLLRKEKSLILFKSIQDISHMIKLRVSSLLNPTLSKIRTTSLTLMELIIFTKCKIVLTGYQLLRLQRYFIDSSTLSMPTNLSLITSSLKITTLTSKIKTLSLQQQGNISRLLKDMDSQMLKRIFYGKIPTMDSKMSWIPSRLGNPNVIPTRRISNQLQSISNQIQFKSTHSWSSFVQDLTER